MSDYLSYGQLVKDIQNFKRSGTIHGDEFNIFDTPSHKYFKILFYFGDVSDKSNDYGESNGLLHPTWEIFKATKAREQEMIQRAGGGLNIKNPFKPVANSSSIKNYFDYNSAWSYLKLNDEEERADKLEKFVTLLSNINSCSPWYFTSISGLDSALERKGVDGTEFNLTEPGKLTITCLPDAFDNRIGTLLELYRDITWSWVNKKEIIPANLRKFDMAIYIFESSLNFLRNDDDIIGNTDENKYTPSYKLIEFHDCEFSYNSIKSGWSELNNQTGVTPTYSIEISYNDCYEISYNELLMRSIGDVIKTDTYQAIRNDSGENASNNGFISEAQKDNDVQKRIKSTRAERTYQDYQKTEYFNSYTILGSLPDREGIQMSNIVKKDSKVYSIGFLENAVGQVAGHLKADIMHKLKRAVLGNLYTYSLTQIGSQLSDIAQGNLIKAGQSVKQYINEAQARKEAVSEKPSGNLFPEPEVNNKKPNGDLFPEPIITKPIGKSLGSIFNKNTIANNI